MRRSKEEIYLEKLAKEQAKELREIAAQEKRDAESKAKELRAIERANRAEAKRLAAEEKKLPKPEPTEEELVLRYVNRTIKNQMYHGRVDTKKFEGLEHTHSVNKNIWKDTDFYFSAVFQSAEQKYEFLRAIGVSFTENQQIQIVNGIELAKQLGVTLRLESTADRDWPTAEMDLMPFVLDNEIIEEFEDGEEEES